MFKKAIVSLLFLANGALLTLVGLPKEGSEFMWRRFPNFYSAAWSGNYLLGLYQSNYDLFGRRTLHERSEIRVERDGATIYRSSPYYNREYRMAENMLASNTYVRDLFLSHWSAGKPGSYRLLASSKQVIGGAEKKRVLALVQN
jgi:hypothetical protein